MSLRDGDFGYHDLERAALGFVLESETWPVFLAWAEANHVSAEMHAWLDARPDRASATSHLAEARKLWAEHSPSELIRARAARML